jgi:hypothetical protein
VTFCTVFVIDLATRRVQVLGTTPYPDGAVSLIVIEPLSSQDSLSGSGHY